MNIYYGSIYLYNLLQERTANVRTLASNTVRWIMGPTGTVVTFPDDTGLPSILEPKPCWYDCLLFMQIHVYLIQIAIQSQIDAWL